MRNLLRASAALSIVVGLVACGGGDGGAGDGANGAPGGGAPNGSGGVTVGPDGVPVGADGKPIPVQLDGTYELATAIDLTDTGIFPDQVNTALTDLAEFQQHPTKAMVDLLNAANVPVVSDVLNAIPSLIRDQVFGFMDDHIVKMIFQDVPFAKNIATLATDIGGLATRFELVSMLTVPKLDANGDAQGTHVPKGVAFHWGDKRTVIDAPTVLVNFDVQQVKVNAEALASRGANIEAGRLDVADHTFDLPIGSFVIYGADALAKDVFGAMDVRDALGKMVDCHTVGQNVANECIGVGPAKVCVGHASDIEHLCTAGLDIIVSNVKAAVKGLDLPALHLTRGTAKMWDQPAPGGAQDAIVDRLDDGFWAAGVGTDDKAIASTFTGVRVTSAGAAH